MSTRKIDIFNHLMPNAVADHLLSTGAKGCRDGEARRGRGAASRRSHASPCAFATNTTLLRATAKRPHGTVYLDYVQVGEGKTLVSPFSVRPRAKAPVSMPLAWSEVEKMRRKRAAETEGEMARWTIRNVPRLLADAGDPWAGAGWKPQRLEGALEKARSLWE